MNRNPEISLSRRLMLALIASMVTMAIPAQANSGQKQTQLSKASMPHNSTCCVTISDRTDSTACSTAEWF